MKCQHRLLHLSTLSTKTGASFASVGKVKLELLVICLLRFAPEYSFGQFTLGLPIARFREQLAEPLNEPQSEAQLPKQCFLQSCCSLHDLPFVPGWRKTASTKARRHLCHQSRSTSPFFLASICAASSEMNRASRLNRSLLHPSGRRSLR